jgi:hypothetical protein
MIVERVLLGYEVVSKIFRTDAVSILKLTIRPIGWRLPWIEVSGETKAHRRL